MTNSFNFRWTSRLCFYFCCGLLNSIDRSQINKQIFLLSDSVLLKEFSLKLDNCGLFVTSQQKHLFFCVTCYENFAVNQKASIFVSYMYVMKEFVHAFSCAYIKLWMHLGRLESTDEARVALGRINYNHVVHMEILNSYMYMEIINDYLN